MAPHHRAAHSIQTPRLLIRSAQLQDADAISALRSDPLNNEHLPIEPDLSGDLYRKRIPEWTDWSANGQHAFMVIMLRDPVTQTEGPLIGMSGINEFSTKDDVDSPGRQVLTADTGVMLDSKFTGKGYATEALDAAVRYAFEEMMAEQVVLETDPNNAPFRRVMQRLDLEGFGTTTKEGVKGEGHLYCFTKKAWQAKKAGSNGI